MGSKILSGNKSAKLSKWFSVPGMLIAPGSKYMVAPPSSSGTTSTGPLSGTISSTLISCEIFSSPGILVSVLTYFGSDSSMSAVICCLQSYCLTCF